MKPRHLIMLALLAGVSTSMPASGGYLVDSSGALVRNSYGECWRTGSWTPAQAIAECDPDLVRKEAPAARPVPLPAPKAEPPKLAAKPAPHMEAPKPAPAAAPALPPGAKAKSVGEKAPNKNGSTVFKLLAPSTAAMAPSRELLMVTSILAHRWAPILQKGKEAKDYAGFGMYTYVLFGRDPVDSDLDDKIRERYDATLSAVLQSPAESGNPSSAQTRGATNLFCLPAKQRFVTKSKLKFDRESYGFPLAQQYLTDFRFLLAGDKDILPRLVSEAGPFLIATLRPLGSIVKTAGGQMKIADAQAPILFIDLTHTHHQVIAEMVDAFKLEVINTKMDRKKRFHPLRVALIDLLKKADDQVTPIREAVAGFMPKEEKKKEQPSNP